MLFFRQFNGKAWFLSGLFWVSLTAIAMPAVAQDVSARLNRLENEVSTLGRAVYRGEAPAAGSVSGGADLQASANMQLQIQQLELEIRNLTGKLEEKDFALRQLEKKFDKSQQDMLIRLQDLEQGRGGSAVSSQPSPEQTSGRILSALQQPQINTSSQGASNSLGTLSSSSTAGSPTAQYEAAFALLKQGQYDEAQSAFEAFLAAHPSHKLAGNAKYWLGETHYVRGQYQAAARVFAEGFQSYPKGAKAPDNLLKLGITLAALDKKTDACVALVQVEQEFPNGAQSVLRRAKLEMDRLACN